jgi:uncharacterized repeat protein (TIGR03837 family)
MLADIFCRVVDNYGDIGVTWRLARQLQQEHGWKIRLWVDDLHSFKRIEPQVVPQAATQQIANVDIVHWTDSAPALVPYPITIASFSCELPPAYIHKMIQDESLWINLEYLSAESWVEGCHGLPSLHADGRSSHFFFPGFTSNTGGLLREATLFKQRDAWRTQSADQLRLLKNLGVPELLLCRWRASDHASPSQRTYAAGDHASSVRLISLFCYPQAPIDALLEVLRTDHRQSILLIPNGVLPDVLAGQLGQAHVVRIPFVPQQDYDRILWTADLNFVRGEDSVIRALWAGKPFVWHIYPQTEDTHLTKLEAWLALSQLSAPVQTLHRDWNRTTPHEAVVGTLREALAPETESHWVVESDRLSHKIGELTDLAASLNEFCLQKSPI